ncbi:MAG: hypothetical protein HQL18_00810 [Candidatus Omnitrophica bacterium]|nr:hypothetical protein [Candidatus Omnitrophota bacterium]
MKALTETILEKINADIFSHAALTACVPGSAARRYSLLKRAMASGDVVQIRRGLYCLAQKYRRRPLDLFEAAQKIYGPSYISFESALSYHGWIPEAVRSVTSASFGKAKEFSSEVGVFSFRRVPVNIFFEGVERLPNGVLIARPFKALLDYIYIYKKDWIGIEPVIKSLRVDSDLLGKVSRAEIRKHMSNYSQKRVLGFLMSLEKMNHEH